MSIPKSSSECSLDSNTVHVVPEKFGSTSDREMISTVSKTAVIKFLTELKYSKPILERDLDLAARVRATAASWGLGEQARPHIGLGIRMAEMVYSHIQNADAKLAMALYILLLVYVDDMSNAIIEPCSNFTRGLCNGSLQQDEGIFGVIARHLDHMRGYFVPVGAGFVFSSTIDFMNAILLELTTSDLRLNAQALRFVEYRRYLSGLADAFACFIWEKDSFPDVHAYAQTIPDVGIFMNYANDILSFYKEELAGETVTFIHDKAQVTGKSSLETLYDVIDETVSAAERVRSILGDGPARDAWECFVAGFISFHCDEPRYRLHELIEESAFQAKKT